MKARLVLLLLCWSSLALALGGPGMPLSIQGKHALMSRLSMLRQAVPHSTLRNTSTQGYGPWLEQITGLPAGYQVAGLDVVDSTTAWAFGVASEPYSSPSRTFTRTTNGGATWICDTIHTAPAVYGLVGISAFDGRTAWVAMYDGSGSAGGGIFRTTDGGVTWTQDSGAFKLPGGMADFIHFFDANNGVCVGDPTAGYLEIYTTQDGGTSWSRVPQANIPAQSGGWEGAYWREYSAAGNSLWFPTTTLGRIFRTTDKGLTWSVVVYPRVKAGWFPAVEFQDDNVGLGNGDFGEFMKTTDGGVTWTMLPLQDGLVIGHLEYVPHTSAMYVATVLRASNALVGAYLFGTAYTTDGGTNWTMASSLDESLPDLNFSSPGSGWRGDSGPNIYRWKTAQGRVIGTSVDLLNFRALEVGQMSDTVDVDVVNFGSDLLTVSGMVAPGVNFTVTRQPLLPAVLPPLGSARFGVCFTPKDNAVLHDSLVFASNASNAPRTSVYLGRFTNSSGCGPSFRGLITRVETAPDSQRSAIVDSFMNAAHAFPFVEDTIAHFIYRGQATSVNVPGDHNGWNSSVDAMRRLSTTDLWFLPHVFERDARIDYTFFRDGSISILDPHNPNRTPGSTARSALEMPAYVPPWEIQYTPTIQHGRVETKSIYSTVRGVTYSVRIYLPYGYDGSTATYPSAYFQDGSSYVTYCSAANILDNLIASSKIKPIIGVFVTPRNRSEEYAVTLSDQYRQFFVTELVPYVDNVYRTNRVPAERIVVGYSLGANISALISYNHPEVFGNCGLQSCAFRSAYDLIVNGPVKPVKYYSAWGTYEVGGITDNMRRFRDDLIAKGYFFRWEERHEGHSTGQWRATIDTILQTFFPATVGVAERQALPTEFRLAQNYPNPFNPSTTIKLELPRSAMVRLSVYDMLGREVAVLVNERRDAGVHESRFDASNLSSGVYVYRLQAGVFVQSRKLLLLR